MTKRQLVLEDGTVFTGEGFGAEHDTSGEIVFYTGMTGYQEVLSDPSYCGQVVVQTYPLAGNYGINKDDFEHVTPFINGYIVKEWCQSPSNFRSEETLDDYLRANNIPGISGIDTRKLTKRIRQHGTMKAVITDALERPEKAFEKLGDGPLQRDMVQQTSTLNPYVVPGSGMRIVLMDFGMKQGVLRELTNRNCHVTVVPYNYSAESILRLKPDGIMLSNGPGDPKDIFGSLETVRSLLGQHPLFGIGLGHQLLALACGADTEKLPFGHRGPSHPVKDLEKNKTFMTSQNHGYTVSHDSLGRADLELTQVSVHDQSVEGLTHLVHPAFSVQYQPESSPGSEDTKHLFDEFLQLIADWNSKYKEDIHA
ncbi:carbamoyl phosphate synthase small subunit [Lentibacillus cibarius]|uniref:Carbamoyl phosphate synthase small chain n=1 Tax=Lentibacillus cibarius TaxID=2583219 RepID=A0A5S3QPB5_9BACI|nr:carbamoyl phosphate synthase small subunit [Lentibacillus cibarius]TMN23518.1 carbamoyl phosphate synthase small subunit [Lentibacillus cibarius]